MVGGGIAGLWTTAVLRAEGWDAVLLERDALGQGQSIQAQGIIHGGGKYALRKVGDVAAMESIAAMPDRWREHLAGRGVPDLSGATLLSDHCDLWLPRGAWWQPLLDRFGVMPLLRHAQVLSVRPEPCPRGDWPDALTASASAVYRMREPVFSTASVLEAIATGLRGAVFRVAETEPQVEAGGAWSAMRVRATAKASPVELRARAFVLAAGTGNEALLAAAGATVPTQRRPLRMFLLRGDLPDLHGHCVAGGRTRLTVTSVPLDDGDRVWQLGGQIAEDLAGEGDPTVRATRLRAELRRCLPGLPLGSLRWSSYAAVRAEAATTSGRRPSGVDVSRVGTNAWAAWPTKWALAPRLAEAIVEECRAIAPGPTDRTWRPAWPAPTVAQPPWENATWNAVP